MTSNMIHIVALGVGLKCPPEIHLNTQWGRGGEGLPPASDGPAAKPSIAYDLKAMRPETESINNHFRSVQRL